MLNHRIELLKRAAGRDGAGQRTKGWEVARSLWADVLFQTGAEVMRADADVSIVKCSIKIRARRDVDASMGARYLGVDYDIKAVLPHSKDRDYMFLVCESAK